MLSTPLSRSLFFFCAFASLRIAICFNIFIGFKWKFMCTKICGSNLRSMSSEKVIHTQLLLLTSIIILQSQSFFCFCFHLFCPRRFPDNHHHRHHYCDLQNESIFKLQAKHAACSPFPGIEYNCNSQFQLNKTHFCV